LHLKGTKPMPFDFVLDQLYSVSPVVKPMFGCHAVYVENKIVLILRKREDHLDDNGVWLATEHVHHQTLRHEFSSMRSIKLFGARETAWQNLPFDALDFEEAVLHACSLIIQGDKRIGKEAKLKKEPKRRK